MTDAGRGQNDAKLGSEKCQFSCFKFALKIRSRRCRNGDRSV